MKSLDLSEFWLHFFVLLILFSTYPIPNNFAGQEISKMVQSNMKCNAEGAPQINSPVSTVAEVAVDQLQANQKLIAGKKKYFNYFSAITVDLVFIKVRQ